MTAVLSTRVTLKSTLQDAGLALMQEQATPHVTYAENRREERPVAGPIAVRIGNRAMMTDCIVGPRHSEVLIGQVVVERLDLIADCGTGTVAPRYPDAPMLALRSVGDS